MAVLSATRPAERRLLPYDPALDGLRAVAVVAVMLYHGGLGWAGGGFLGVDLFFVLSGYLITTLLVLEGERTGRIELGAFWFRRARRLFPALFLVLVWVVLYAALVADSTTAGAIRGDVIATTLYVANWESIVSGSSYFEQFAAPSPLQHTWSLAIEEQWYLLWPIVVAVGLTRVRSMAVWTMGALVAAAASALLMAELFTSADPSRVYYGTDTRVQALLLGAALAFVLRTPVGRRLAGAAAGPMGPAGLLGFLALVLVVDDRARWMYRGGFTLVALSSAMLIAGVTTARHDSRLRACLAQKPIAYVGLISYGLYLWHWPMYVFLTSDRTGLTGTPLLALRLMVTFAVASASYALVERPIRELTITSVKLATTTAASASFVVALALVAVPDVNTPVGARAVQVDSAGVITPLSVEPESQPSASAPIVAPDASLPGLLAAVEATAGPQGLEIGAIELVPIDASQPIEAFLVGDSVYLDLALAFERDRYGDRLLPRSDVRLGCGVIRAVDQQQCDGQLQSWAASLAEHRPHVALLGFSRWDLFGMEVDGEPVAFGGDRYDREAAVRLERNAALLGATGARVMLIGLPCMRASAEVLGPMTVAETDPIRVAHLNNLAATWADERPDVDYIDLASFTCPTGEFQAEVDGVQLFRDGVHFTEEGAALVWSWLVPEVERLARAR